MEQWADALQSYNEALRLKPDLLEALHNRGVVLQSLNRFEAALAGYDRTIAIKPDFPEALNNRGSTLRALGRLEEALTSFERALAIKPAYAVALYNRGVTQWELGQFDASLASYEAALAAGHPSAFNAVAYAALHLCRWNRSQTISNEIAPRLAGGQAALVPFVMLGYGGDAALQLRCAQAFVRDRIPARPALLSAAVRRAKIKLAYLSNHFRRHAIAALIANLLERHDRDRFELFGISLGPDDGSVMRMRLAQAFDHFLDVSGKGEAEIAHLLTSHGIDIAIDLGGHAGGGGLGALSYRPCPVQVSYLGFPGPSGADFIDYVIADSVVLPFAEQDFYTERIVHLPHTYQANDPTRPIVAAPSRAEAGLPEQGFVFCCFNNNWKITEPVFAIWMGLLAAIPDSVLWLMAANPGARENLCREATARGIASDRLVFADFSDPEIHLARHRLADLFLDTLPYNAHTTASDALWAGLPVVTCRGSTFCGRVAASLLEAAGLPELVTGDLEGYEALALRLARDKPLLHSMRQRLERNRLIHPLFDADLFRRHIEAAYVRMWEIATNGDTPQNFSVPAENAAKTVMRVF